MYTSSILSCLALSATWMAQAPGASAAAAIDQLQPRANHGAPRVVGGQPAAKDKYGSIAYIRMATIISGSACTGTLITPSVVLTSNGCLHPNFFTNYKARDIDVGFGLTPPDPKKRFKGYAVSKIVPHPESMSSTGYNDLALLVLNDTIPSSVASTTKIYSGDYYIDTPISVAGFGLTDPKNNQSVPTQLMEASLAVGKDSFCKKSSRNFSHKTQLCTDGTGDADACFGDGGGPLVTPVDSGSEFALLAITSYFGLTTTNSKGDCAVPGAPTFYTRIGAYIDWIAGVAGVDAESISVTNKTQHPAVSDDASDSEVSASASRSYTGLSRTSTGLSRPTGTLATASPLTKSADASRLLSHSCIALLLALASIFAAL